jgi:polysaccharide export outer membrane protein
VKFKRIVLLALVLSITLAAQQANYVLGPDDQVTIFAPDAEDLSGKPQRVDLDGYLNLPMVGAIHAAGMSAKELAAEVKARLKKYLTDPQVTVSVADFQSQPVSVLGEVNAPGIHQLQGHKTLFEVLSLAGGLRVTAGSSVRITRDRKWGRIPLANAHDDPTGQFSVASLSTKSMIDAGSPAENIEIKPEDVISVPKAGIVYVVGAVHKPGGFVLGEAGSLSALQVLSLAEGLDNTAAPNRIKIMRSGSGSSAQRVEISLDVKKLLAGQTADVPLRDNDILFVPSSFPKSAAMRALETAIGMTGQIGAGLAIYH